MIYFPVTSKKYPSEFYAAEKAKEQYVSFQGFALGENTSVPAFQLKLSELAACIDLKYNHGGQLQTRDPIVKYSTVQIGVIRDIASCSLNGTQYTIVTDATKVYYIVVSEGGAVVTPTEIGTVGSPASIVPYNDVAVICDGSYLKFCDSTTAVKMAYDAGTGGTFYNNYTGIDNGVETISANGVGCTFTTPAWTAGYTIPPTKVSFKAIATDAVSLTIEIIRASDSAVMATQAYTTDDIATTAAGFYSLTFPTVAIELAPSTEYYALLKGANVNLSYTDVAGAAGKLITNGSTPDTAKSPIMRVHPGLPPKASWAVVSGSRLWVYDPDAPGQLSFSNLTHLDFSTVDGGGYVGAVDEDKNSYKIGAAADLYGELYVYGTEEQPYICKLTGATPSVYELPLQFQRAWSTARTLVNTTNDVWSANSTGVDALLGVEAYGDIRTFSASDSVKDKFTNWVSTTAFAGYNAADGQYWLYMPTYDHIMVGHTKLPITDENSQVRYPWSRYHPPAVPSCFNQVGGTFMIGSTDGYIYKSDPTAYKDLNTTQIAPSFKTAYVEFPFKTVDIIKAQMFASSLNGSSMTIAIHKNGSRVDTVISKTLALPMSDAVTLADIASIALVDLADVALSPVGALLYFDLNINCYSFQVEVSGIHIAGKPVFINGIIFKYRELEA